jgi:DNA polymerase III delta prime subunit
MALLLHKQSQARYDSIKVNPPQGLLLVAPVGSGKEHLLRTLASDILGEHPTGRLFELYPEENKKLISIDAVRSLKIKLKLKSNKHRVVLVPHAELLSHEAQNSILKLLEEPPEKVHFFMSVCNVSDVIDTISSRTSIWKLVLPTPEQINDYYKQFPDTLRQKAIAIGESRMGLIDSLITQQETHSLIQSIDIAKQILSENHFNRLARVDSYSKNSELTKELLDALRLVCNAGLKSAAKNNSKSLQQWHRRLELVLQASEWIDTKVNSKLVLSYLFMRM